MILEKLDKDELLRVQLIAKATWPDTFKEILQPEQIEYMIEWMYNLKELSSQLAKGHQFYCLSHLGQDIGFIGFELNYPLQGQVKLHKIYVLPSSQGIGAGRVLLGKVVEIAKENKFSKLFLNVNKFNSAIDFYLKHDFKIISEQVIDIGNGFVMDDYVMVKTM